MTELTIEELNAKFSEHVKGWAKKLGKPEKEFTEAYTQILAQEKETHSGWTETKQAQNAMRRTFIKYKKQLSSPGQAFTFIVVGCGDPIDTVKKRREQAFKDYEEKGEAAAWDDSNNTEGTFIVKSEVDPEFQDEKGAKEWERLCILGKVEKVPNEEMESGSEKIIILPIDTRATFKDGKVKNRRYGTPLSKHSWMRNMYGLGVHLAAQGQDGGPAGLAWMEITLNDALALAPPPPFFMPLKSILSWRPPEGTDTNVVPTSYSTGGTNGTKFELDIEEGKPVPNIEAILKKYVSNKFVNIAELGEWHDAHEKEWNRFVFVEGDVHTMNLDPGEGMSRTFLLDDISLGFGLGDTLQRGIKCWLPDHLKIDFGEESRVISFAKTNRGKGFDPITGDRSDTIKGDVTLGPMGVYALPEYRIDIEAPEITKDEMFDTEDAPAEDHKW